MYRETERRKEEPTGEREGERGREGREKGEQGERRKRFGRERKGGRKCIMSDDTCVSVVLDRHPCCLPYRWHSYSSAVASLHSSVWLAHAGYHLMNGGGKRYKQMVGERLLLEGMVTCA